VLVVQDMDGKNELSQGKDLVKDLDRGRAYIRDTAQRYGVLTFSDIYSATEYCIHLFKSRLHHKSSTRAGKRRDKSSVIHQGLSSKSPARRVSRLGS